MHISNFWGIPDIFLVFTKFHWSYPWCFDIAFQVLCQCVLLFLRVQSDYHQMCSSTVAKLLQILIQVYSTTDSKDVLQQMNDLDLLPQNARHSPNRSPSLLKKKSPSSSPKIQAKHGALKSSFFSLFEKKMPSEESKSAFYVDLEKQGVSQSDSPAGGQVTGNNQSDILVQIGLDPVHEEDQGSEEVPPNFLDKNSLMPQSASSAGEYLIVSDIYIHPVINTIYLYCPMTSGLLQTSTLFIVSPAKHSST